MFYEGKAKKLYSTPDPDLVIAYFKDDATAFNAKKKGTIEDKGVINNRMSELFFTLLEHNGVKTHFVRRLNDREMLCKRLRHHSGRNRRAQYRRWFDGAIGSVGKKASSCRVRSSSTTTSPTRSTIR